MLFFYFLLLFFSNSIAEEPKPAMEIVVEAHKDFEIYVAHKVYYK